MSRRIEEIMNAMNSFSKSSYQKKELLPEMFALQQEIVELTFNDEHAATSNLKIWDVEKHLAQLNHDCGHVADEELARFKEGSKTFCNLIRAEVSGSKGEDKAFRELRNLRSRNYILKNVELKDESCRTELDAVVITNTAVFIIEVKNTGRDIFIDENGDYFRTGEYTRWDSNIAEKMNTKEEMLLKVLQNNGIKEVPLQRIVVFTNHRVEVRNKYEKIKTCFLSQLADYIDGFDGAEVISQNEMIHISNCIKEAECKESYPFEFNIEQYKLDYATVMSVLEEANSKKPEEVQVDEKLLDVEESLTKEKEGLDKEAIMPKHQYATVAGSMLAGAAATLISMVVLNTFRKEGLTS